jgi:hypothetical protein
VALKNKYDPTNLYRHNQNTRPTAEGRRVKGGAPQIRNGFVFVRQPPAPSAKYLLVALSDKQGRRYASDWLILTDDRFDCCLLVSG